MNKTSPKLKTRKKNKTNYVNSLRELQNISTEEDEQEKINIIFYFNQEKTEIFKHRYTSLKNLITSYLKRENFQNKEMIIFLLDGNKISYNEAINDDRKLNKLIPDDIKEKEILVYDWPYFGSKR